MPSSSRANANLESIPSLNDILAEKITSSISKNTTEVQSVGYLLEQILLELQRIRFGVSLMADEDLTQVDSTF